MTPEGALLNLVMDWLAAERIFALRMNTGAVKIDKRFLRFGVPGLSDILAFPSGRPVWIECKAPKGRQSELQKSFQDQVVGEGHIYVLAYSLDDVIEALRAGHSLQL
jgi:hypothetical protein